MSSPAASTMTSNTVGNSRWSQGDDAETNVEVRVPIVLPAGARPKELTVEVKDGTVLCVKHKDAKLLQWRLFASVESEVEWRVDEKDSLIMDLVKKNAMTWPCLLDLPMDDSNPLLATMDELNTLFARHLPTLPEGKAGKGAAEKKDGEKDDDLDKLLDEAASESVLPESPTPQDEYLKTELENFDLEMEECVSKLRSAELKLQAPSDDDAKKNAEKEKEILERMINLCNQHRELRTKPTTLQSFLLMTRLQIQKARANVGSTEEEETEEYKNDEEKELTPQELLVAGLKYLEDQDLVSAIHLLRLAAIHHNHIQSVLILLNIYGRFNSPRGASLILHRALDDDDMNDQANQKTGELFDTGSSYFIPLFPAALFFYQRSAKLGNVQAMLAIAQLYLRGSTASTLLSEEEREGLVNIKKYHAWMQEAMDRGCGSAYFVKGCMHIKGEHGMEKSYKIAKENLDRAAECQPEVLRRAPQIMVLLEKLRMEEEGTSTDTKIVASPKTLRSSKNASPFPAGEADSASEVQASPATSSLKRLNALSSKTAAGGVSATQAVRTKKTTNAASSASQKAFWERAAIATAGAYTIYTLTFPIRLILIPYAYGILASIVERFPFLANPNAGGNLF